MVARVSFVRHRPFLGVQRCSMGGKGRRHSRSRERSHDNRWQYSKGKGRWFGGYQQQYGKGKGKGDGYGQSGFTSPVSRAASLVQELQELGRQQQQEAQATSLLQRFVGAFSPPSHTDPMQPPDYDWLQPHQKQSHSAQHNPPSWLGGLLEGLASKFAGNGEVTPPSSSNTTQTKSQLPNNTGGLSAENEIAKLRQELQALKDEKRRQEQEAEKRKLRSEIEAIRAQGTVAAEGEAGDSPLTAKKPATTEAVANTVEDWCQVDVEKWNLQEVSVTTAQQKAWIAKVRPSSMKGWSRSPVLVSDWLTAERTRLSVEDLNTALEDAGMAKANSNLTRDLCTLQLLAKVVGDSARSP